MKNIRATSQALPLLTEELTQTVCSTCLTETSLTWQHLLLTVILQATLHPTDWALQVFSVTMKLLQRVLWMQAVFHISPT